MSTTSSLLVLLSCVIIGAGLLTGCSSGALPGGTSAGTTAFRVTPREGGAGLLVWNKGVEFSVVDAKDVDDLRRVALGILAG